MQILQTCIKDIYINNIGVKTMQKLDYYGWTNYETWNYKLWLDNEYKTNKRINSLAKSVIQTEQEEDQVFKMSELLKMECMNNEPNLKPSFYSDVLSASLKEVNFYEIAEAYIEDNREELEEIIKEAKHLGKLIDKIA